MPPGEEPENFDKEFVRLAYAARGYRGDGEPPAMPDELVGWRQPALHRHLRDADRAELSSRAAYPVEPRLERSNLDDEEQE